MTVPVQGRITAKYNQMRPLTAPVKTHIHGAIDIGASVGTPIVAPETGYLYYYKAVRPNNERWNEVKWLNGDFEFQNYFYDVYGSIIILIGAKSGLWHVIAHSYWNQLYNKGVIDKALFKYQEQRADSRFPVFAYHTLDSSIKVFEGAKIGEVGNAGFSTGAHAHIEIHEGKWQKHEDRVNPEVVYGLV